MYSLSVCRARGHLAYVIHNEGVRKDLLVEKDKADELKDRLATLVGFHIKGLNKLALVLEEVVSLQDENDFVVCKEDEALYNSLVVAFNKVSLPVQVNYVGFDEVRAARYVTSKFVEESREKNTGLKFSRAIDIF